MFDLIIHGGQVVTPQGVGQWDVAVVGEKIALGGPARRSAPRPAASIDANGKIVVPGGIEPHAHLASLIGMRPEGRLFTLGPEEDTVGMAFGGTTTHIDFCFVHPATDIPTALARRAERWKGKSYVDYSFHLSRSAARCRLRFSIRSATRSSDGFPTFKVFTAEILPPHPKRLPFRLDYRPHAARDGKDRARRRPDGRSMPRTTTWCSSTTSASSRKAAPTASTSHLVHTKLSEQLSFNHTIQLAARHRRRDLFRPHFRARGRRGGGRGPRPSPADLRRDPASLRLLHRPTTIASRAAFAITPIPRSSSPTTQGAVGGTGARRRVDHRHRRISDLARRQAEGKRIDDVTGGNLGAEARMGIVYTEGVVKRGMSLERFADVTSTNAARILGSIRARA